jgi:hypothetical protein
LSFLQINLWKYIIKTINEIAENNCLPALAGICKRAKNKLWNIESVPPEHNGDGVLGVSRNLGKPSSCCDLVKRSVT